MRNLEAQYSDGVIIFDTHTYKELVLSTPRPYEVNIVYSVD